MSTVCRFCVRWTDNATEISNLTSLDVIKQLFGLQIECCAGFPHHMCDDCCTLLEHSLRFYEQLIKSEKSLRRLHETGKLASLLAEPKSTGETLDLSGSPAEDEEEDDETTYYLLEENDEEDAEYVPVSNDDLNGFIDKRNGNSTKKLLDIKIEAIGKLETVSVHLEEGAKKQAELGDLECSDAKNVSGEHGFPEIKPATESEESDRQTVEEFEGYPTTTLRSRKKRLLNATEMRLLKEKDDRIPNKCYICDKVFPGGSELDGHLLEHEYLLPYYCEECDTNERTIVSLNKHLEKHTYKFVCSQCPLRYRLYSSWYEHYRNVHVVSRSHTCPICAMHFDQQRHFFKHMAAHRNKQMQRYKCATCAKIFQTSSLLKRHELVHSHETPFKCPYCGRGFKIEWNLKMHRRRHLRQTELYKCTECDIQYANFLDWRRHMKDHFPEDQRYWEINDLLPESLRNPAGYPNACTVPGCVYVAASLQLMWPHYRTHFKAFQCEHCMKKFSSASTMRLHINVVHQGARPYECNKCGKRFGYRHKLQEHLNGHDGVRNLKCRYCEKMFTHASNLSVHEQTHGVRKAHQCDLCGSQFRTSSGFAMHRGQIDRNTGVRVASKRCVLLQLTRQAKKALQQNV